MKGTDKRYMGSELKRVGSGAEGSAAQPGLQKLTLPKHGSTPSRQSRVRVGLLVSNLEQPVLKIDLEVMAWILVFSPSFKATSSFS